MRFILIILIYIPMLAKSQVIADTVYADDGAGGWVKIITYRNTSTTAFVPKSDTAAAIATKYKLDSTAAALAASTAATYATITTVNGKQSTLISEINIKTINGASVLGSGDLVVAGAAAWGSITGTLANQPDLVTALNLKANLASPTFTGTPVVPGYLPNTSTAGVGTSPTSSSTQTITHNLGRVPTIIRIYGYGTFTSNAAATATTSSMGLFNSSGNFCVYQRYGAAITTTQAGLTSNTFCILLATGGGSFISGVIQNVTSSQFDIIWSETGTATAQPYLWEVQ